MYRSVQSSELGRHRRKSDGDDGEQRPAGRDVRLSLPFLTYYV